ncbi:hypothetical protein PsYK624_081810 [Phanerochaete sordida]|uniref:Fungal-type protein kinase domain-containing protein n=1 Tax=Phanerochaete sordida TaxID=48140 RepID=A0A9P3G9S9_9APHY|nr:hypothetical protein PsYK624_081810 [Phanerochaete sordida]
MSSPQVPSRPPVYGKFCPEYNMSAENSDVGDFVALDEDMQGHWHGFIPLQEMFDKFFPALQVPDSEVKHLGDKAAQSTSVQSEIREPWIVDALRNILSNDMTIDADPKRHSIHQADLVLHFYPPQRQSHSSSKHTAQSRPASLQAPQTQSIPVTVTSTHSHATDITCDLEHHDLVFPFRCDDESSDAAEMREVSISLGQLAASSRKHFERQHRVFLWHAIISEDKAHLVRWDRAGAIVSEGFDPITEPWLYRLLWAYSRANRQQQGFDLTTEQDGEARRTLLHSAIRQYEIQYQDQGQEIFSGVHASKDLTWPVYRVDVPDDKAQGRVRQCLISRPFYTAHSPLGRGTRVYVAYDLVDTKLRILKDAWRPDYEHCLSERMAYDRLESECVEYVPRLVCGGDIADSSGDPPQSTATQDLVFAKIDPAGHDPQSLPTPRPKSRRFVHYRILEDIALPLEQLRNSRELLRVVRDIVTAIRQAYNAGELMHRDITWANMRWCYGPHGIHGALIDWDHAERIDAEVDGDTPGTSVSAKTYLYANTSLSSRKATWHFMPLRLIDDPHKVHELVDDLESLYWSLLHGSLRFVKHNDQFALLDDDFFSSAKVKTKRWNGIRVKKMGAPDKRQFLTDGLGDLEWDSTHFTTFMREWTDLWACFYRLRDSRAADHEDNFVDQTEWDSIYDKLSDPARLIRRIQKLLAGHPSGWVDRDIVSDQLQKMSRDDIAAVQRAIPPVSDIGTSRMSVDPISRMASARFDNLRTRSLMDIVSSTKRQRGATGAARAPLDPAVCSAITSKQNPDSTTEARPAKAPRTSHPSETPKSQFIALGRSGMSIQIVPLQVPQRPASGS